MDGALRPRVSRGFSIFSRQDAKDAKGDRSLDGLHVPFVSHSSVPNFASGFFLASFASLREASPFSIFSRQDAKGAKVFKPAGL